MAHCKACGSTEVVKLSSINQVRCNVCRRFTVWRLEEGQQSVLENKRGNHADESEQALHTRDT